MDRAYYDEYYFLERNHWWFVVRSKIISDIVNKLLTSNKQYSILNIGVATGATNYILNKYGNVTSIEYDKVSAYFTFKDSYKPVIIASIEDLPFKDNSFDVVCAFDVIEHVENDSISVFEMQRICKEHGKVVITVPAFMSLWSYHDEVNNHLRRYRMRDIISLFNKNKIGGLEIHKTYFNTLLFPFILSFRTISKIFPNLITRQGAGSDFIIVKNESFINKIFFQIFNFERIILKNLSFNFGASILYVWKKQGQK